MFTSGEMAKKQFDKMHFVLKNYLETDINLLESLIYQKPDMGNENIQTYDFQNNPKNIKFKSPLHLAIEAKNTRMINLLLFYLSKIDAIDYNIKDIFKLLINY